MPHPAVFSHLIPMHVSSDPAALLAKAVELHRHGRLKEAQVLYAQILRLAPGNTQARYFESLLHLQAGETEAGIAGLRKVLKREPAHVDAHYNLGLAYQRLGKHDKALESFERVLALQPGNVEARFHQGLSYAGLARYDQARVCFEQVIARAPDLAVAHLNLGNALAELEWHKEACAAFEAALARQPDLAEAHNGLGAALVRLNRYEDAARHLREAIRLRPDMVEAYTGLSDVLRLMGQYEAALGCCEESLRIRPDDAAAHVVQGQAQIKLGRHREALAAFGRALEQQRDHAGAHNELGGVLHLWGRHAEATRHGLRALALAPGKDAMSSSQLFNLHYDPNFDAGALAARHRAFGERFEAPLQAAWAAHTNVPDPNRTLKIGFVSADFRNHPVGYFMADLVGALAKGDLELFAYATHKKGDTLTERIRPCFGVWRDVLRLDDDALANQIRADGIDILVDLSGHTEGNRLLTFARKPAPVQVTYLGYFNTTGLAAMDYILSNDWLLPSQEESLYTETPWRLPDAHLCFSPPDVKVEVSELPARRSGEVVFGCFNKIEKVNDKVIACWARILDAVPNSKLHLKAGGLADPAVADAWRNRLAGHGIPAARLILEGESGFENYLRSFNSIDIALDPFPYNGGTVTVHALWMGVPVLTLHGDHYVAHMGESILHSIGMPEWVAMDEDDYVAKAVAFSRDLDALATLRGSLRERLLASPICDALRFARNLEAAFRGMWAMWCGHGH